MIQKIRWTESEAAEQAEEDFSEHIWKDPMYYKCLCIIQSTFKCFGWLNMYHCTTTSPDGDPYIKPGSSITFLKLEDLAAKSGNLFHTSYFRTAGIFGTRTN